MWIERLKNVVMRTWKMELGGHRKTGRPEMRCSDVKCKDTKIEEAQDRITWILKLDTPNPNREKAEQEDDI